MRLVILDFDGTMTDAEAEGRPFVQGYLETAKPVVHDYVHAVRAALLLYGYRDGKPFEHHAEDADDFAAVARNASRRDSRS